MMNLDEKKVGLDTIVSYASAAKYLYEVGYLKRLKRAGWSMIGVEQPETVAEHSLRAALVGYMLAILDGSADPARTAVLCLFHDMAETRIGDLHRVAKRYLDIQEAEAKAAQEQVQDLPAPLANAILAHTEEYEARKSRESQLAHDADLLECLIQAQEYCSHGYKLAEVWATECYASLRSETAKKLANACLEMEPVWWNGLKKQH